MRCSILLWPTGTTVAGVQTPLSHGGKKERKGISLHHYTTKSLVRVIVRVLPRKGLAFYLDVIGKPKICVLLECFLL